MTVDRDVWPEDDVRADPPQQPTPVSRAIDVWYVLTAVALVGWFLWGWLVLRQGFVDSVGESLGTAFGLLLVISIVGTLRQSRR